MQRNPIGDIPIFSELVTALLALMTGIGMWYRKRWAVPCSLALAGMWAYGVIGGIALVFRQGLDFSLPYI
jgi:4-hydroxybenzoate polyprenyltransferase